MCTSANQWIQMHRISRKPRRTRVRVLRLSRVRKQREEKMIDREMEMKNLKLYMENISISQENEKLRKKATILHRDNLALKSELLKRSSRLDSVPVARNTNPSS